MLGGPNQNHKSFTIFIYMKTSVYRNLAIHSFLIFVLSFILNTSIHEGAHALMGKIFGLTTVLHHNYVSTGGEETSSLFVRVMVPAAGPLMSLLQGIIFLILLRTRKQKSLITLFYLWMSVFGFINVGGYLMMTPLFAYGDTGKVFTLLNSPPWLMWLVALAALIALMMMILNFTTDFEDQIPAILQDETNKSGKVANALIALPVLLGCVATTILAFPVPTFLSLLYPATSPFITFWIYGKLRGRGENLTGRATYPERLSLPLILFVLTAIVITRLLVKGIAL